MAVSILPSSFHESISSTSHFSLIAATGKMSHQPGAQGLMPTNNEASKLLKLAHGPLVAR
jgi:hypothetical protein